ncbi:MAG: hypothetical protein SGI88_00585, partial [Candidatus Hydrogenedentes bacterium]|nr:hypothetical protein [Candidatus Hydrogenedentota bacterium]
RHVTNNRWLSLFLAISHEKVRHYRRLKIRALCRLRSAALCQLRLLSMDGQGAEICASTLILFCSSIRKDSSDGMFGLNRIASNNWPLALEAKLKYQNQPQIVSAISG